MTPDINGNIATIQAKGIADAITICLIRYRWVPAAVQKRGDTYICYRYKNTNQNQQQ